MIGVVHRLSAVFESVYSTRKWANGSGSGSAPENTASYRTFLQDFIATNGIATVVDLGCGDWQSSRLIDWRRAHYFGYDVVRDLIELNRRLYARPLVRFEHLRDYSDLPAADLLIVKDVLQHLPNVEIEYIATAFPRFRHILVTNTVSPELYRADGTCLFMQPPNTDIPVGAMRPVDVLAGPFRWRGREVHQYWSYRGAHGLWEKKATALVYCAS